jgi:hypothetical protein
MPQHVVIRVDVGGKVFHPHLAAHAHGGRAPRRRRLPGPLPPDPRARPVGPARGARAEPAVWREALCRRRPDALALLARVPALWRGALCGGGAAASEGHPRHPARGARGGRRGARAARGLAARGAAGAARAQDGCQPARSAAARPGPEQPGVCQVLVAARRPERLHPVVLQLRGR